MTMVDEPKVDDPEPGPVASAMAEIREHLDSVSAAMDVIESQLPDDLD